MQRVATTPASAWCSLPPTAPVPAASATVSGACSAASRDSQRGRRVLGVVAGVDHARCHPPAVEPGCMRVEMAGWSAPGSVDWCRAGGGSASHRCHHPSAFRACSAPIEGRWGHHAESSVRPLVVVVIDEAAGALGASWPGMGDATENAVLRACRGSSSRCCHYAAPRPL